MLIVNCNPIKKLNSWEFPLSIQMLSFKSHFWVSQFSGSLQFIFCDLKKLRSPHKAWWISPWGWCSAQVLPKHFPAGAEESPVCDWITLHWTPRQINEWGDAKPGRGTSCYQNPEDYNEIHQVDQLPCQGLKFKRTSGFQKPGWDFSQLCLLTHLAWSGPHLVKNHVLVQILPHSDISRYIKIFTTIFITLEEEMGYVITYLQHKNPQKQKTLKILTK